ncbi:protein-export chaperone SecB [Parabacteroides sp. GYB001]|uniref:protein-export chaperone SecB n=1 Tax=Parabacteroides leei TaxID=2939491 RepID=UPI002017765B|nr:protein-export chaperone SecB [Parabacteroides leei]MCL3851451.1 protein-export chaperone SecB [Parabacteroides leei]
MSEKIAKFRFKGYKILNSSISVKEGIKISSKLNINFGQTSGEHENGKEYRLKLVTSIEDENNALNIKIDAIGLFEFDSDIENYKNAFFSQNAPAILFPYVRAYISTLTSLSGIPPVILPTLNLSNRNNTEE